MYTDSVGIDEFFAEFACFSVREEMVDVITFFLSRHWRLTY